MTNQPNHKNTTKKHPTLSYVEKWSIINKLLLNVN